MVKKNFSQYCPFKVSLTQDFGLQVFSFPAALLTAINFSCPGFSLITSVIYRLNQRHWRRFFTGVNNTGFETVATISACLHLKANIE
jgi:hypothetical protein